MKSPMHSKSVADLNACRLKQLCPIECAMTHFFNEHFLYGQYYFSMYKHSYEEVKPDYLHNSTPDCRITNRFSKVGGGHTALCLVEKYFS